MPPNTAMFNLEQFIAEWRRRMSAAGIKSPVPLEELEGHLREEIDRQIKSGVNEQEAFAISVQRIGQPEMLKNEFTISERNSMKKLSIVLLGVVGFLVGMALIMPAAHLYKEQGMVHDAAAGFSWGIPLALLGISGTIYGFKKRKA